MMHRVRAHNLFPISTDGNLSSPSGRFALRLDVPVFLGQGEACMRGGGPHAHGLAFGDLVSGLNCILFTLV